MDSHDCSATWTESLLNGSISLDSQMTVHPCGKPSIIIEDINFPENTVLVIDDYHLIDSLDVNSFIEFLLRNEIDNLNIILTARFTDFKNIEELKLKGYVASHH